MGYVGLVVEREGVFLDGLLFDGQLALLVGVGLGSFESGVENFLE